MFCLNEVQRRNKVRKITVEPAGFRPTSASPNCESQKSFTLQRMNEAGVLMDDFNYGYYTGTNRLREVLPVTEDKVISSGPVHIDNIVYRNVTINGTAYVPAGEDVEVKALEDILMDPAFEAPDGTSFWAHIVEDEGTYQYGCYW